MNTKDNLGKFEPKSYQEIFLWYLNTSKAYKIYIIRTNTLEESIHVKFNETPKSNIRIEYEEETITIDPSKEIEKLNIQEKSINNPSTSLSQNQEKSLDGMI